MADGTGTQPREQDRAAAGGGKRSGFASSIVERLAMGYDAFRHGRNDAQFFNPAPPMQPVAPQTQGRAWDYPTQFNMVPQPRREGGEGMDFASIRAFADNYDLLRLVIETRKDQLCKMEWNIVGRNKKDRIKDDDARVLEIEKFFRRPDRVNSWNDWLRILVEDMLVIDAATLYPRRTLGGQPFSMDIIDGGTIKLLINPDGRTPLPPEPAYQQAIKGMPASEYTLEELIYRPRNKRSWKMYGYSPVEQIIMTVNIALRRQVSQLQYYTEGNIPEAFGSVPEEWTPDQIREMQTIWDSMIEGQQQNKRKVKFIPGGVEIKQTREATIKDVFDEWLARIVCYAFSVSPQALVQMMNRATAETASEEAALEGLAPLQTWIKDLMDYIIEAHFGYDDLVFAWSEGKERDPKTQSEVHKNYIEAGVLDADEVREELGRDPRGQTGKTAAPAPVPNGEMALQPNGLPADQPSSRGEGQEVAAAGEGAAPIAGGGVAPQLDEQGNPVPTPLGGEADIQGTAMNGTQVSSLLEIVTQVAGKDLPKETAKALIMAAYPAVKEATIDAMLNPLDNFEAPKPDPILGPDGNPIAPGATTAPDDNDEAKGTSADAKSLPDDTEEDDVTKHHGHAHNDEPLYKASPLGAQRKKLSAALATTFAQVAREVADQLDNMRPEPPEQGEMSKAARPKPDRLIAKISLKGFGSASDTLQASIEMGSTASAAKAAKGLRKYVDDVEKLLKLANTRAEAWAKGRAAELIGKNANGGELADTTRDMLRTTITQAEEEGWSNARLRAELEDNYAFSRSRADTIARTEMKTADSEGAMAGWKASGLKMKKEWVRSADESECDICEANEAQGPIDLNDTFESGDETSPAHPNCECAVLPVIDEENL